MKILDKIKQLLFSSKVKKLPEPKTSETMDRKKFVNRIMHSPIQANTIEYAIDQYTKSLYYFYENYNIVDSYKALVNIEAYNNQEKGNNEKVEEKLIRHLKENSNYKVDEQTNNFGEVVFYHIKGNGHVYDNRKRNSDNINIRLYINLERKNIATFVNDLVNELQDKQFYLKFIADNQLNTKSRSESIVVYTNGKEAKTILDAINNVTTRNPKLVENTRRSKSIFETSK